METNKKSSDNVVRKFRRYLKLEKGHSENTVDAYMHDIEKLSSYLKAEKVDVLDVKLDDLEHFAASISEIGIGARSLARILSGVRHFLSLIHI